MSPIVAAAIARIIVELPEVTVPADDNELGYGVDLSCVTDFDDDFACIGPNDPRVVLQALARRFQTPRGTLPDDPDYGFDVCGACHKPLSDRDLRSLQSTMVSECVQDQRVDTATVRLEYTHPGALRAVVHIVPHNPRFTPFSGVMRITKTAVEVEP